MKNIITLLLVLFATQSFAQKGMSITPEFGISMPIGTFQSRFNTSVGSIFGLHADYSFGKIGLGLYAGGSKHSSEIGGYDGVPQNINDAALSYTLAVAGGGDHNWKTFQLAMGPVFKTSLSEKLCFGAYLKGGIAKLTYPSYSYIIAINQPFVSDAVFFENDTPAGSRTGASPMIIAGVRMTYALNNNLGVNAGTQFSQITNVYNEIGGFTLAASEPYTSANLLSQLQSYSSTSSIAENPFQTLNFSLGLTYSFLK